MMEMLKVFLLVVLGLLTVGSALGGIAGVVIDFSGWRSGCLSGMFSCLLWTIGWILLGVSAVSGLLLWAIVRFMPPRNDG